MKRKIVVPTDMTPAAENAIRQAIVIAKKSGSSITLAHVLAPHSVFSSEIKQLLEAEAELVKKQTGFPCDVFTQEGNLFEVISHLACEKEYDMMVIGTHGLATLRQKFFGADILKMVMKVPIPVLVVQEDTVVREDFKTVVLPVSSHDTFNAVLDGILLFFETFKPEVHLYSIHKAGFPWSDQLIKNIEIATEKFSSRGIPMKRVKEEMEVYSLGYARQTIKYANTVNADAIFIISAPTEEFYYFANADKESIILNEFLIPAVSC